MASINKVILVGNLGKPPQTLSFPNGDKVTNVTVATTDRYKDRITGEMQENTEWHRVSFFGRLADIAEQYLQQGALVYIEGSLRTRKWTDQSGVERYTTEIRADSMQMLGSRPATAPNRSSAHGEGYDSCALQSEYESQSQRSARPAARNPSQIRPPASRPPAPPPRHEEPALAGGGGGGRGGFSSSDDIPFGRHGHAKLHC